MQKSVLHGHPNWSGTLLKTLLVMKLVAVFLLVATLQVSANPTMGQTVNVNVKKTEIRKILKMIEDEGDYRFLFNSKLKDLKKKVDFSANNLTIDESLNSLFVGANLSYKTMENNVILVMAAENAKIKVTGRVTGPNGPVAGATVAEKGTRNGVATDANGNYTITVEDNATLVISSIGYETQEVAVSGRTTVDVTMAPAAVKGDEVVVIGYGTANRRDLTGSIAKVSGETLAAQPNSNALSSLQSKVAGVQIVNTAVPGSAPDIRIRGTISIGSTRPIYIIDGIFSDNMDFVNPNDIESIEILKDPSSLAVFGIKGAAGAVLVTTKKGKAGQMNINFNSTYGIKKLVDKIELANGAQFRSLLTQEANTFGQDNPTTPNSLLDFVNGANGLAAFTGNTDWIDAVTRTAKYSNTNLSVESNTDRNRFRMGLGYTYDEGLVKHVRYDRLNLNFADELKMSQRVKIGFSVAGSKENLPYQSGALENARRALPIISADPKSIYTKNPYGVDSGYYNLYSTTPIIQNSETNPLSSLENNWDKKIDVRYRLNGYAYVDVNILKDLNFRATWYGNLSWRDNREYTPLQDLYNPAADPTSSNYIIHLVEKTAVSQDIINTKSYQQDYIATYKKKIGEHNLTLTGGITTFYNYYEQISASVTQNKVGVLIIPDDPRFWNLYNGFTSTGSLVNRNAPAEYTTFSGLGRLIYNYKNKYYVNASYRRDGSSQINADYDKKFQNFWAVGLGWEISKEKFMENFKALNYLKLKGSTGLLGNFTAQGKDYPAYPTLSNTASAVFGDNRIPVVSPDYQYDPNLRWETVKASDIGFESDWLNRRLHFEADYYVKKTDGLIVLLTPSGQLPTLTNNGSIKNQGFEFSANWTQKMNKDLVFNIGGNLTTFKNKVTYIPFKQTNSSSEQTPNAFQTGFPIGYFYGYVVEGIYQSYTDILNSPTSTVNGGNAKPGDLKYKDLDGNDIIDDNDRQMIGNPTPDFIYGINLTAKYKNFDLAIDCNGSYGNEVYRVWGTSEQKNSVYNYPAYYTEGWTTPGSSNWVPIVSAAHLINRAPSSYGIEDGSYFRIRNLTLGYTFNKFSTNKIKNIRLSASVQNLKTWKNNIGYSPEFAGDATGFGMDFGNAGSALPRIISFGINANF